MFGLLEFGRFLATQQLMWSSCQVSWEGDEASSHRVYFQQEEEKDISGYYLDAFCKLKGPLMLPRRV